MNAKGSLGEKKTHGLRHLGKRKKEGKEGNMSCFPVL